ncbi:Cag pathogenicity island protein Cag12 [Salmonella enterica subsp. enterica serovar Wichita]|nr:Cag pathogenicity island protein Cag12 [Salmonella enterica subsp. enterica serovar Wichita]
MRRLLLFVVILAGCSSPPEPTPVEWDKTPAIKMNTQSPRWKENNTVVPAKDVTERWSRHLIRFTPDTPYLPAVYYTVTHSTTFIVFASSGAEYFKAKDWLIHNGAAGVITYKFKSRDNKGTEIFLSR